jgi:hypothetical protein
MILIEGMSVSTNEKNMLTDPFSLRIAAIAPFSGLRHFPQGRHFKQWTGDDSKGLMKVYIPAIEGHVPQDIIRTFHAFLDFCYLVRRNVLTDGTLTLVKESLKHFHNYRNVFSEVVATFSLPRQHAMKHYPDMIRLYGTPNGLCSSITESKHIKAVKEPYCHSNRHNALGQMLLTNQQLDKLARCRTEFNNRRMLDGSCVSFIAQVLGLPMYCAIVVYTKF